MGKNRKIDSLQLLNVVTEEYFAGMISLTQITESENGKNRKLIIISMGHMQNRYPTEKHILSPELSNLYGFLIHWWKSVIFKLP